MYRTYNSRPIHHTSLKRRQRKPLLLITGLFLLICSGYTAYALLRPLPAPRTVITPPVTPALVKVNIPWPKSAAAEQAAYGAEGYGLLASSNPAATPVPTASVTKVITAMAVLQKKPLKPGETGPVITLTAADLALYNEYVAKDGSVVPVAAGQSINQYQALQALLLPSANNIADTLVNWAFGDMAAYTSYANGYVKQLGMNATTVTDASGFSPQTVSTAADLVKLGDAALDNPVFADIVKQPSAKFPGHGTIRSTNRLLGQSGIIGIKTGNTEEAGGCYLAAADVKVGDQTIRTITAVMAAPDLAGAMRDSLPLIQSTPSQFQTLHVVRAGQNIGSASTAWGSSSKITASRDIDITTWTGMSVPALTTKSAIRIPADAGADIGDISLSFQKSNQSADLNLSKSLGTPTTWWRLTHPF